MADSVGVTPGAGANIGAVLLTMPDTTTAYVSAGLLGTNVGGTWTAIASGNPLPVTVENSTIAVTGTFYQSTQPVSAAALPLPTGAATAANQATAQTSLSAIATAVAAAVPAGSNTIGFVNAIQAGDTIEIGGTTYTVLQAFANCTGSTENTLISAVSGKKFKVLAYSIGPVDAAVNVYFDGATDGALSSTKYLAANGGVGRAFSAFGHVVTATNNQALRLNISNTSAHVGVDLLYIQF
jgi:hypothetical protein